MIEQTTKSDATDTCNGRCNPPCLRSTKQRDTRCTDRRIFAAAFDWMEKAPADVRAQIPGSLYVLVKASAGPQPRDGE